MFSGKTNENGVSYLIKIIQKGQRCHSPVKLKVNFEFKISNIKVQKRISKIKNKKVLDTRYILQKSSTSNRESLHTHKAILSKVWILNSFREPRDCLAEIKHLSCSV